MPSKRFRSRVDGNHVLYHYLEKDLREKDIWLFQMLAARLFTALGIWISPTLYARCPILIPFAVRDPTCRPRKPGDPDLWGTPNSQGYFRDDNSLVKSLPKSLRVDASDNPLYHDRVVGRGFVAAHAWRVLAGPKAGGQLSARDPETNTFVPNLVWLPTQVAKLTDREGSFAQTYLQALAVKIYRGVPVRPGLQDIVERCWTKLQAPVGIPANGLPDVESLAYFREREGYITRLLARIATVRAALLARMSGTPISGKVVSSRYTEGLPKLSPDDVRDLAAALGALLDGANSKILDYATP